MGTSVLLIFVAPIMFFYLIFGNLFAVATGEKTEVVLPYDEARGIVWEYEADEDYYVNLVETRIEGDEQIFVFQDCKSNTDAEFVGGMMDLIFTDKNGNQKKYYACSDNGYAGPLIYEEDECLITEYTVTAKYPREELAWRATQESNSVLIQPLSHDITVTFTIVYTPANRMYDNALFSQYKFTPMFYYTNEEEHLIESVAVRYKVANGKLVIDKESHYVPHPPAAENPTEP